MASSRNPGALSAGGIQPAPLPQVPVLTQLRATPRIFAFEGALLITAMALGSKEVARWQYIRITFDSEWGIGAVAAVSAVTLAVTGVLLGRIIDRRDPRPYVILAMAVAGIGNVLMGVSLLRGPLPMWLVLVAAVFDGAALGIGGIALLKTQAAFVRPGAEGAAEILNILRLGIGGVVGALLAGFSPDPSVTLLLGAVLLVIGSAGAWLAMRPVKPRLPTGHARAADTSLRAYLHEATPLRRTIVIDLVLALVIPTQLVNLAMSDLDVPELASRSIAAGMVGVLAGRIALTVLGFRGNPRVIMLATVGGLAAVQLLGSLSLTDGWLLKQALALPLIVIFGSALSTYAQGLLAAIIQQQVVEEHRGGVSSLMVVGRNILISVGALLGTFVAATVGSQILVALLGCGLVLVIALTRGFASVPRV